MRLGEDTQRHSSRRTRIGSKQECFAEDIPFGYKLSRLMKLDFSFFIIVGFGIVILSWIIVSLQ